jgi:hypothetical protein
MKNTINISLLFFAVLLIFSCGQSPTHHHNHDDDDDDDLTLTTEDTISLQTFQTWVGNWETFGKGYTDTTLTTSFTMPLVDITEFLENRDSTSRDSVVAARFYLGMEVLSPNNYYPHLLLVGVDSEGDSLTNDSLKQYIYDLSKPCPNLCGHESLPDKN